eukprot:CAMPEP_0172548400 /NCGR_PEP_ID=MMETSP1067-20121228/17695_1 /TAXON_ID=265564 ORGANISM="Thalassiosira punctigera, Strain Tpunct2005C2" /NCGR_SAMPLE_ID=MMETSP1067 /ASSEMBLY_ACC=CAM_ASM_000444 /LENGTH=159 /DNA_ID=CAMNT_0013335607 /DNA_START=158 /DNA_END=637 /DNA_ORIENTATION=-
MKDLTGDGKVNLDDFVMWGKKVAAISNLEYTEERQKHWEAACEAFFPDGIGNDVEAWMKHIGDFENVEGYLDIAANVNTTLFSCIDIDPKDGKISPEEFRAFVVPLGVTCDDDIKFAFEMIDENKDGYLSVKELSYACARYYFDKEDSPYKHFYGKFDG